MQLNTNIFCLGGHAEEELLERRFKPERFYRFDTVPGRIFEKIQLQDDPFTVRHGAKLVLHGHGPGYIYFCDDTGWICRVKWT